MQFNLWSWRKLTFIISEQSPDTFLSFLVRTSNSLVLTVFFFPNFMMWNLYSYIFFSNHRTAKLFISNSLFWRDISRNVSQDISFYWDFKVAFPNGPLASPPHPGPKLFPLKKIFLKFTEHIFRHFPQFWLISELKGRCGTSGIPISVHA